MVPLSVVRKKNKRKRSLHLFSPEQSCGSEETIQTDDITDREVIFRLRIPYGVKARVSLPVKDCENMLLSGGNWEFEGELLQQ